MGELASPGPRPTADHADAAIGAARHREDVVVGEQIVRHRYSSRVIHWSVAVSFVICLLTGLPIWTPIFGWMAHLFGGLSVCGWLHPWAGTAFFVASAVMFVHWAKEMVLRGKEKEWLGPKMIEYLKFSGDDPTVGKYNGGQKLLFWLTSLGAVGLMLSGLVLWNPLLVPGPVRQIGIVLHDVSFLGFVVAIIGHVYLGTAAEPGTFRAMTRGTVTKPWARLHHPAWYREVTGDAKQGK
ncbi:MAG: formate dehydrogenase subunit gamma [Myxococcales bacterium]